MGTLKVEVHEVEGMQLLARTGSGFAFVRTAPRTRWTGAGAKT